VPLSYLWEIAQYLPKRLMSFPGKNSWGESSKPMKGFV
jgi:hypothetical protein